MKTVIFWIFFVVAVLVAVLGYLQLKKSKKPSLSASSLLPDSCLVYLNSSDVRELDNKINQQSLITDRLQLFPQIAKICSYLHSFDSLIGSEAILEKELSGAGTHMALYPNDQWLICFNIKELGMQQKCLDVLTQKLKMQEEKGLYQFLFLKNKLFLQMTEGVVLLGNQSNLIWRALTGNHKLENSSRFKKFKAALTQDHLFSIYIDQTLYNSTKSVSAIDPLTIVPSGFCAGSVNFEPSELKFNGFQFADSSTFIHSLLNQGTESAEGLLSGLPYNTAFFEAYACSNFSLLSESYTKVNNQNTAFWDACSEAALYNVKTQFTENIMGPLVRFETFNSETILSFMLKDSLRADETIQMMCDSLIRSDSTTIGHLRKTTEENKLFDPLFKSSLNYVVRLGDRMYFSKQLNDLLLLIPAIQKGITMFNNESFSSYRKNNFPDNFSYLLYTSPAGKKHVKQHFFKLQSAGAENAFENFKHLSYSLQKEKDYFKFRFHVLHERAENQKNILWSAELDTVVSTSPFAFVNHLNKENEVIVQDVANTLYLLNAKGNIIWRKKLDEKIISDVFVVDLFKNNKYQMLFNTSSALHLIDRNGKYVENYPVKLPAPASAALSVFDYENTLDYRLLIPCKNKNIYNYMLNGKKVDGFSPVKTEEEVRLPLQYVTVGESQYLVALDTEGKIYTFSRKGIGRIGLRNRATVGTKNFYIDPSGSLNSTYLVYLDDKTAVLNKISFSDLKSIVKLSEEIEIRSVRFCQVDENRNTDLLLTGGNQVRAYDFTGNLISENESDLTLDESYYYADESHALLISHSIEHQFTEVFDLLHNNKTRIASTALPLMKDLFKENKQYLVVPSGKTLSCVFLN